MSTATAISTIMAEIETTTAGRGHKTNIPPVPSLNPSRIAAQVVATGSFWMSHTKILGEFNEIITEAGFAPVDTDDEDAVAAIIWFLIDRRLRPGMAQVVAKVAPKGHTFSVAKSVGRGRYEGVEVTIRAIAN